MGWRRHPSERIKRRGGAEKKTTTTTRGRPRPLKKMKDRLLQTIIKHALSFGGAWLAGRGVNLATKEGMEAAVFWGLATGLILTVAGHWLSWGDPDKLATGKAKLYGQVRHTLQDLAGFTIAVGWLPAEVANQAVPFILSLVAAVWSIKCPGKPPAPGGGGSVPVFLLIAAVGAACFACVSCTSFDGFGDYAGEVRDRVEVQFGVVHDGEWVGGPIKARLRPPEVAPVVIVPQK